MPGLIAGKEASSGPSFDRIGQNSSCWQHVRAAFPGTNRCLRAITATVQGAPASVPWSGLDFTRRPPVYTAVDCGSERAARPTAYELGPAIGVQSGIVPASGRPTRRDVRALDKVLRQRRAFRRGTALLILCV